MDYELLRSLLFLLPPEKSHHFTLDALRFLSWFITESPFPNVPAAPCTVMGIPFPNPIGISAGLDKNADYLDGLALLGAGFIEVGTVTPKPQVGNPLPRLFRLKQYSAIINRMGFNNKGIHYLIQRLKHKRYRGILGINIGKQRTTSIEAAVYDYLLGFRQLAKYADYITINISSPNTPNLRDLQSDDNLITLINALKREQALYAELSHRYVPLAVKIAPDLNDEQLKNFADIALHYKIDGIIAANTTIRREAVQDHPHAAEVGGLSGKPLFPQTLHIIELLHAKLQNQIPLIAVGGIMSGHDAKQLFQAGANLVQIYTGLIYRGPNIITEIVKAYLE